jgi:spore photoproduct lyase
MRKSLPDSQLVWFPFENENKVYHYPSSLMREMEDFVVERLSNYVDSNKVFRWDN